MIFIPLPTSELCLLFTNSAVKLVASTAISNKTYTIEPVTSGKISDIMIETSYLSLLTTAPGIVTDFMAQGASITDFIGFDVMAEVNGLPIKVQKI